MTVPACEACNSGWADDEAHFRNVMVLAGEPNDAVRELWSTKTARAFRERDGRRRLMDLLEQMKLVQTATGERHMIFPAKDERVMRVVRKVIRGLCYYHSVLSPVSDEQVWANVLMYGVPPEFLNEMPIHHREQDIFEYRYEVLNWNGSQSGWLLTFFERRTFIGIVSLPGAGS